MKLSDSPTIDAAVAALAAAVEYPGAGFRPADLTFGHSLAGRLEAGVPLTPKQARAAHRMLAGYRTELTRAGIDYDAIPVPPVDAAPVRPTIALPFFTVIGDRIMTSTPFAMAGRMRDLPGAQWHAPEKCRSCMAVRGSCGLRGLKGWHYPATPSAALSVADSANGGDYTGDEAFEALVRAGLDQRAAGSRRTADDLPAIPLTATKAWNHQKQAFFFGMAQDAVLLDMEMGPVAASAEVTVNRGGNSRRISLGHLCAKLTDAVPGGRHSAWDSTIPTRIRVLRSDGRLGLATVTDYIDKGVQPVVRVTLTSGHVVTCTPDHEIVTLHYGKVAAADLTLGSFVMTDPSNPRRTTPRVVKARLKRRPGPRPGQPRSGKSVDGKGYVWLHEPSHPNANAGGQVLEHVKVMSDILGRKLVAPECIHHGDLNKQNNDPSNLILCANQAEHARYHDWRNNLPGVAPTVSQVVSVTPAGEEHVYCVRVDDDAHTFVADGIVVSNTGKSKVAVDLLVNKGAQRSLIMCPERVVGVWPKQFRLHAGIDVHVLDGRVTTSRGITKLAPVANRTRVFDDALHECNCGRPHVVVANYAITAHEPFASWALAQHWDATVLDEIHKIKSPTGVWSKWCAKLRDRSAFRMGLTGTLMPHTPLDVFAPVRALDAGVFGSSATKFRYRYGVMGGFQNKQVMGIQREDELAAKVSTLTYRVGAEVLDLPAEVPDITVGCTLSPKARRIYHEVETEMYAEVAAVTAQGVPYEDAITAANVLVKIIRLQQLAGGALVLDESGTTVIDTAKRDLLEDTLADIDPSKPIVVFARFRHDLDSIQSVAESLGRTYGELSGRRSDALADDATLAEGVQVAGVQMQSGGTGVDFTRSHYAVYYSAGHSLGDYMQSRKRLLRPGQTESVRFIHLVAEGTIDEDIYEALAAREQVAAYVGGLIRARQEAS